MKEILLTSSVLILALLALRRLFRRTISRRMQYALWLLVLMRLLVPLNVGTLAHNVLSAAAPVQAALPVRLSSTAASKMTIKIIALRISPANPALLLSAPPSLLGLLPSSATPTPLR
jgi:beta-lactamase regulating signal transducer with metallopeptidase domain